MPIPAASPLPPADRASLETIVKRHHWSENLFSLQTTRPAGFQFTPGQFARLGLAVEDALVWRAYSVVSAATENYLEFYIVTVPDGIFTTALNTLHVGDAIWVDKASYGIMTADRFIGGEDLWLLATGTGLGPFVSILHEKSIWDAFKNIVVVHGVRYAHELAYRETFTALAERFGCAKFRHIPAVTREPDAASDLLTGRITALLQNGVLESSAGLSITPEASRVMLCGNPQMIGEMRQILQERGLLPVRRGQIGNFIVENYW